jgi:hypothetical protein
LGQRSCKTATPSRLEPIDGVEDHLQVASGRRDPLHDLTIEKDQANPVTLPG